MVSSYTSPLSLCGKVEVQLSKDLPRLVRQGQEQCGSQPEVSLVL